MSLYTCKIRTTSSEWGIMMAASLMAMAPIFILFFTMQKRVIDGLATSGMK